MKILPIAIIGILLISGFGAVALPEQSEIQTLKTYIFLSKPIIIEENDYIKVNFAESDSLLLETGKPAIPIFSKTFTFPVGTKIKKAINIQNWIAFEAGLACALSKDLWVFDKLDSSKTFSIPYLTDYMLFNEEDQKHVKYVRKVIKSYEMPLKKIFGGLKSKRDAPPGEFVECENCKIKYATHSPIENHYCPSCHKTIKKISSFKIFLKN